MAKKTKSPPAKAPAAPANVEPEVAKKVVELKTEGNNSFARGDYQKALTIYDDAIKLLPANAPERADFHNNKAACFIGQKRYKEAVKECTSALEVAPNSVRALQRRAKAYEQQGLFKLALADISTINKTDAASPETQEQERRLREAAARRPASATAAAGAANGAAGAAASGSGASKLSQLQQGLYTAKCSLGDDTKLVHLSLAHNYADVLTAVQAKFPAAGPFALKYVDKAGDLVTITCKADLHVALGELVQQYQRQVAAQGSHGPKLTAFPPLKLHLAPVASAADVPKPPVEEELERQQLLAMQRGQGADRKESAPSEELHVDSWLLEFAQLFIQQTGLEPDKHVELHNMGWEAVTKALDATVQAEAAVPLFDKAKDSFRDVTCTGLTSWGQVHQLLGNRALEAAAKAGKGAAEVRESVLAEFEQAEKKYKEALSYNSEFFDALCNMSQVEFDRCKLTAGLMPSEPKPAEAAADKTPEQAAADTADAVNAAMRVALAAVNADGVTAAQSLFESALSWAERAIAVAPSMDARQKEAQAKAAADASSQGAAGTAAQQPPEYDFRAQALVLKGNYIYEWSQMLAAVGQEWRPQLDGAVGLFREAGCPEKDIRVALRNHFKAAELDIPAEEPEAAPEAPKQEEDKPAAAKQEAKQEPAAEEKPKAKGLPSLEVRKAKK
ncbi:hypothetical protein Agub_g1998 [Astrephomene gubernaculifera]|uniref:PB1 domain-containing protein n=1 Tax=Astrephomene gubernaculifera TaxID=47775 RepID=A0AAD3HI12_9CHLO|nr:hypothetical protein Agub_g1998 [Astrephomene gubernaculifera]